MDALTTMWRVIDLHLLEMVARFLVVLLSFIINGYEEGNAQ